jgi:hypothetical protein
MKRSDWGQPRKAEKSKRRLKRAKRNLLQHRENLCNSICFRNPHKIRRQRPNALLLLRTGDNYTVFGKDASIVSRILGMPLTKQNGSEETGFPANALDINLPLLVRAGQRVAISETLETPQIEKKQEIVNPTQPRLYSGILQERHK